MKHFLLSTYLSPRLGNDEKKIAFGLILHMNSDQMDIQLIKS